MKYCFPAFFLFFLISYNSQAQSETKTDTIPKSLISKALESGYVETKYFNFDLRYLIKYNQYEGVRTGIGGITNDAFSEKFRINSYGVYGFRDHRFKYSVGGSFLLAENSNTWISLSHTDDLQETGSTKFLTDKRFFQFFEPRLLNIDLFHKIKTTSLVLEHEIAPNISVQSEFAVSAIQPTYSYGYVTNDGVLTSFDLSTAKFALQWSPLRMTGGTQLLKNKMSINFGATLDPYALNVNGRKINTFNYNNGGSLFRLTNAGLTMNYSLASKKEKGGSKSGKDQKEAANNSDGVFGESLTATNQPNTENNSSNTTKETKLYGSKIPWTLKLAYSLNYSNTNRQNEISSNSLMFSGDIELTPKWGVGFSSGYDVKNQGFTYTQLRFSRDLDSWKLNFNWVPFGERQTYYFFIGVKSSMLSDLKYDKRKVPDRRLF